MDRKALIIIVLVGGIVGSAFGFRENKGVVWPGRKWDRARPEEAGMDAAILRKARDYALTGGGSGCVIRQARCVMHWGDQTQRYDLKSTTKAIGITAVGLALKDEKINSLRDRAKKYHPSFGNQPESNIETGWLDKITLFQLATQTSGFDKSGGYTKLMFEPGTKWSYSDGGPNWLAECVTLAYEQDLNQLMFERVFGPIGISTSDLTWRNNAYRPKEINGIKRREFGSGISANVDAMARIGYLYLRRGRWQDKQIIPTWFVDMVRIVPLAVRGLPVVKEESYFNASDHYGLLWWNNADGTMAKVPRDAYWSWGLYDSLIVVIPSLDIVAARAGKSLNKARNSDYKAIEPFIEPIVLSVTQKGGRGVAPYPPSPVITDMRLDWSTHRRYAQGSDNWPITWADDDHQYTAWGDGGGFGGTNQDGRVSLGVARIEGPWNNYKGYNVWGGKDSENQATFTGKSYGIICVAGTLYMWVSHQPGPHQSACQLAWSRDYGAAWHQAEWIFRFEDRLTIPTFLNFGQNYQGARDDYVYSYFIHPMWGPGKPPHGRYGFDVHKPGRIYLSRVPTDQILKRSAHEFFAGLDTNKQPLWSLQVSNKYPVFEDRNGVGWCLSVSYNPGIGRYILCTEHDSSIEGIMGIFDAPQPWGPWTTVKYYDNDNFFGKNRVVKNVFFMSFATKWLSIDGKNFTLIFTGGGQGKNNDSFNTTRGSFALNKSLKKGK